MRAKLCSGVFLTMALVIVIADRTSAADAYCAHCGCAGACKACRLVCEEKKVEVLCWGCKREDFCVPGPSKPGCRHCETVCESCDCGEPSVPHAKPKNFVWFEWLPGGAKTYTRTKLMRKTVMVTVPSYKWVVEELCPQCSVACGAEVQPGGEVLPSPAPAAR
jgi:hypothetical protein